MITSIANWCQIETQNIVAPLPSDGVLLELIRRVAVVLTLIIPIIGLIANCRETPPQNHQNRVMTLQEGDMLNCGVQCIVNAANTALHSGGGVCGAIFRAAGSGLQALCDAYPINANGNRCDTGKAALTSSLDLSSRGITHIIHAVGPVYNPANHQQCCDLLASAYRESLTLAAQNNIRTLAFPAISTAIFGFPIAPADEIAFRTVETYLHDHPGQFDAVKLMFLGQDRFNSAMSTYANRPNLPQ